MRNLFKALKKDERGVSALEYAILAGVLVVVIVAGVTQFGNDVKTVFTDAGQSVKTAVSDASNSNPTP